ncbi:hypothetical protein E2C01_007349 [Portunus trituberculatus]|uniref:Uncharacterized protein n=1 Tax=Portunus trituberculatus TaxID=210409 RepID=A0A5B7D098_PORTR|nr:hypothetical protein [Portunus trituberculatus]
MFGAAAPHIGWLSEASCGAWREARPSHVCHSWPPFPSPLPLSGHESASWLPGAVLALLLQGCVFNPASSKGKGCVVVTASSQPVCRALLTRCPAALLFRATTHTHRRSP